MQGKGAREAGREGGRCRSACRGREPRERRGRSGGGCDAIDRSAARTVCVLSSRDTSSRSAVSPPLTLLRLLCFCCVCPPAEGDSTQGQGVSQCRIAAKQQPLSLHALPTLLPSWAANARKPSSSRSASSATERSQMKVTTTRTQQGSMRQRRTRLCPRGRIQAAAAIRRSAAGATARQRGSVVRSTPRERAHRYSLHCSAAAAAAVRHVDRASKDGSFQMLRVQEETDGITSTHAA